MRILHINASMSQHSHKLSHLLVMSPPHWRSLFRSHCAVREAIQGGVAWLLPDLAAAYCHWAYLRQLQTADNGLEKPAQHQVWERRSTSVNMTCCVATRLLIVPARID